MDKCRARKRSIKMSAILGGILIPILLTPVILRAQVGNGTILGRVTDQTGAVVQHAKVTLRNEDTDVSSVQNTNSGGQYTFPNLIPGKYSVTFERHGFKQFSITHIVLAVNQTVRENAALTIGHTESSIHVTAKIPLVQTDNSSVGGVIDQKQIQTMPLNGRSNIFGLLALAPGVQDAGNAPRIGGATTLGSYNETIDGSDALEPENEYLGNGMPSLDSIAEFKVVDSTGSAKNGNGAVSITITTKSGTNHFHGSLYEYNRVAALEAKNYFAANLPNPPYVRNEFGGSLGGPIIRKKLFFFGSFGGLIRRSTTTQQAAMPTPALLNGDFAGLAPIIDPETGLPFPGNQIPASRISPVSQKLFPYFDTPNLTSTSPGGLGVNWVGNVGNKIRSMSYEGRGDYVINSNNRLSVRYYMTDINPNISGGPTDKFGGTVEPHSFQNYSLQYNHDFSASLANVFSIGYNRVWDHNASQNSNLVANSLIPGLPTPLKGLGGLPSVNITGFSGFYDWSGSGDLEQTFQFSDNLTSMLGKHLVQAGFSVMHWKFFNYQNPSLGSFTFTGQYTGNAFADFLLGYLAGSSRPIASLAATPTNNRFGFYVQDTWSATPRLTLNYGIRYELPTLYQNIPGNMSNWYPKLNKIVVFKGTGQPSLFPGVPFISGSSVGVNSGNYIGTDKTQIAPRFGLIYRPLKASRLIIRGGYGLYYQMIPWAFGSYETANNPPFTGEESFEPSAGSAPSLTFANPFPSGAGGIPSGISVNAYPKHYSYPMTGEWNLTVESQIASDMAVRATYMGEETEHLTADFPINRPVPAPGPVQPRRPYQPFGPINLYDNIGTANTQELQLSVVRRFSKNLSFDGQYAWTKMLDEGASLYGTYVTDPLNIRLDRGNDGGIRQQYFVGNYVYALPFGKGQRFLSSSGRFLNAVIGGWETTGILTLGSGLPYSVTFSSALQGWPSNYADRRGNPVPANRSIDKWFNPAAFSLPTPYTYGDSGANKYFGPRYSDWDTSASKHFVIGGHYTVTFAADFFNALNQPNFGNPNSDISVPSQVGRITSAGSPRQIEFSGRLEF